MEDIVRETIREVFRIPYYLSYRDFIENFNKDFANYKKTYSEAEEIDFKEYCLNELYGYFFDKKDIDNTLGTFESSYGQGRSLSTDIVKMNETEDGDCVDSLDRYIHFFCNSAKPIFYTGGQKVFILMLPFIQEDNSHLKIDNVKWNSFRHSLRKIAKFLTSKDNKIEETYNTTAEDFNIKINIKPTELVELVKALYESGTIRGKQKDLYAYFAKCFNVEVNNPSKLLQDIKNRNNGSETLFLDELKTSLFNYITK